MMIRPPTPGAWAGAIGRRLTYPRAIGSPVCFNAPLLPPVGPEIYVGIQGWLRLHEQLDTVMRSAGGVGWEPLCSHIICHSKRSRPYGRWQRAILMSLVVVCAHLAPLVACLVVAACARPDGCQTIVNLRRRKKVWQRHGNTGGNRGKGWRQARKNMGTLGNGGTELLRSHYRWLERLYDEAKATVMARYTYDEHDCLTLTGIHSGMESDP